ncbi:MAG: ATP binding [Pycnora praestabilis]|nr:MAG: ATP binding [Pycnora praestabilis]
MAMLASKSPYPAPLGLSSGQPLSTQYSTGGSAHRGPTMISAIHNVASPTESEFSEVYDDPDSVRNWDERQVAEWLRSVNCGQYVDLFRANNFNGENLLESDQATLKDMGIKKIGDRVRLSLGIKNLRNSAYGRQRKRNRDSIAVLDSQAYTPSSSGSPKPLNPARHGTPLANKRQSILNYNPPTALPHNVAKPPSRPNSPLAPSESRGLRGQRHPGASPMESRKREQEPGYFSHPSSANSTSGRRPTTPGEIAQIRAQTHRRDPSVVDGLTIGKLPPGPYIRVIYSGGETKVVKVQACRTSDDIIYTTLKKFSLPENHIKNYCFYILYGTDPDPQHCRRISDPELVRICGDTTRAERNRLILRKIHAGEPGDEELTRAAQIATEETTTYSNAISNIGTRSQLKVQKLTGEPWEAVKQPMSPASFHSSQSGVSITEREQNVNLAASDLERRDSQEIARGVSRKIRQFFGQRPPSELISSDLTAYFPDHQKEAIENTVRMSIRRSARLSRATSRLSTASNLSFASSMKDAPPIPSIADTWLTGSNQPTRALRPLSITRIGLPSTAYRDSVASSVLEPLQEESPIEPNRKSYVSFESGSESANIAVTDPDGHTALQSYFDDLAGSTSGTEAGSSLNEHLTQAIAEDGEEQDEELTQFLADDSWENIKYMQGALIGQGSFGSVYLALHAITGELMAVKRVEMPSNGSANSQLDARKQTMVAALKQEISLLKELQHPHIVQYLGASSDEEHLNIFLEYVPGGSVAQMLVQYGNLHEPLIRNFVRQILIGLSYLHGKDIIHRDIKGANVLVDNKGLIKISDFGISKRVEVATLSNKAAHRVSLQGSVFWMAPEVVKQTAYTRKADIWSLGCLIVEMFTGSHPYPDSSQLQAIFKIGSLKASPEIPNVASEEGHIFLKQAFEVDHEARPSADDLLLSPFLKPIA